MIPTETRGATHNFQKPDNWNDEDGKVGDLQVRAELLGPQRVIELFSTWKPSPVELVHLNAGGVIEIGVCTPTHPVMQVRVVDPLEEALRPYVPEQPAITINERAHGDDHG